ncbi:MAG: hypothetical protein EOO02_21585 [Chitinophagaceae bacterium]|nr:MAG: hypothetical protein EOO02_21585 [Chitinophagaceae bacterium]
MGIIGFRGITAQLTMVLTGLLVSCLMQRLPDTVNVIQHVIYYTPVYMIGIVASINRQWIYDAFSGRRSLLLLLVSAIFWWLQSCVFDRVGSYHYPMFKYAGVDMMLFQKVFFSLFLMVFLHRFELFKSVVIKYIATASFALFFVHGPLIVVLPSLINRIGGVDFAPLGLLGI